jgi:O-acetylhomoserine (thiol)-lyase
MKLESIALHHGYTPEATTRAAAVPIYQTTSYTFDDTQHGADLFDLKVEGNIYTRIMNPTTAVLEARVAEMEGGIAGLGLASGMAAITYAIQTIAGVGDNIVSVSQLYGGTYNLFVHAFPRQGIEVRLVDGEDFAALEAAIDGRTKAVFLESIGNPAGNIVDIARIAEIAHRHGVPVIVDNTVATPYPVPPVRSSARTSWSIRSPSISAGHGTTIGGMIMDSGKFDWTANKQRFPILNEPDPSYHGVTITEALGPAAYIGRVRVGPLRNTGAALAPHSAFLLLQGLETLGLRMERHCENAQKVAEYLQAPIPRCAGSIMPVCRTADITRWPRRSPGARRRAFSASASRAARRRVACSSTALQMILRLVNIGDAKSLACHPATTTHRQLSDDELAKAGVSQDLVRISVGIEHADDIIADIEQALAGV